LLLFNTTFQPTWPFQVIQKLHKILGRFMTALISVKRNIWILHKSTKIHNDTCFFYIIWKHAQNIHNFKIVSTICVVMNLCTLCQIRSHFLLWDLILQLILQVSCVCSVLPRWPSWLKHDGQQILDVNWHVILNKVYAR